MKKCKISFFFTIILILSLTNSSGAKDMANHFTWNVQMAGYDYTKYDEKGDTDYSKFILEFEKFPWIEQLESYQRIQKGCSPTLTVNDSKTKTSLWISMAGDKDRHEYLVGYVYPKMIKGFFGLGKETEKKWLEIYSTEDTKVVKDSFRLFFNRDSNLSSNLKKLKMFDEMEAQN